jgi:iron complex outermembrane recepter protein
LIHNVGGGCGLLRFAPVLLGVVALAAPARAQDPETVPTVPVEAPPASAAGSSGTAQQLDPIVVTVTKREKAARDLAGSVGAMRGSDLEHLGALGLEDHLKLVPGVSLNKEMSDRVDPTIRGIATETRFQSGQRATGIYVDEVPLSDAFIPISQPDLSTFDLERIEVMKGPQGTLFGSMALAGAIHYVTEKPAFGQFGGKVLGTLASVAEGGRREPHAAAVLNVPIGDSAALRGVMVTRDEPGFIDDARTGQSDIGGLRQRHSRVLGAWQPVEPLTLRASWLEQRGWHDDSPFGDQRERLDHGNTLGPSPTLNAYRAGNIVAAYDFGWGTLQGSSSKLVKEARLRLEVSRVLGTGVTGEPLYTTADAEVDGLTQEVRLASPAGRGRWEWLVGAWRQHHEQAYDQYILIPGDGPEPPPNRKGDDLQAVAAHYQSNGRETAVFGDIGLRIIDPWTVSFGGRLYRIELESRNVNRGLLTLATFGSPRAVVEDRLEEDGFNPRLSSTFRFSERVLVYALAARGFRFGGVQLLPPVPGSDPPPRTYRSDTLWNYEGGVRTDWLDQALTLDAAVFEGRWRDLQITQLDSLGLTTYVANIGAARTRGLELSLSVRPFRGVTWTSVAAWIEARTAEPFAANGRSVPPDTALPGTPRQQWSSLVSYEEPFAAFTGAFTALYSHVGPSASDLFGTERLGDYATLDLRARLRFDAMPLRPEFALGMANVTDVRGVAGAFATPTGAARDFYFITPRTLSLTTTLSF